MAGGAAGKGPACAASSKAGSQKQSAAARGFLLGLPQSCKAATAGAASKAAAAKGKKEPLPRPQEAQALQGPQPARKKS